MRRFVYTSPAAVGVLILLAAGLAACGGSNKTTTPSADAEASAQQFLMSYVDSDGRVVRRDQGGDTVSEGQAYGMLLAVSIGNRAAFTSIWAWSQANLRDPDGLLAYHWSAGHVVDANAATDADLDIARALVLASQRWHDGTWLTEAKAYAEAILTNESATAHGRLWLVAGPWDRSAPYYLDPSYYDPATFELLGRITGDPRWAEVEASSATVITAVTSGGTKLPPDWATLDAAGQIAASKPPSGGAIGYGYDAFRTLIRQTDDCATGPGVAEMARLLPLARQTAAASDREQTFTQAGAPLLAGANPVMLVAAAGAARAAGKTADVDTYLAQAQKMATAHPSYYLIAWVALAQTLLTTTTLRSCPS